MSKIPSATIAFLTRNAGTAFAETLDIATHQDYPNYDILLIDSQSSDGTYELAKKYNIKRKLISPNDFGHGRTRNLAAKLTKSDYIVFVTQDALPVSNQWLSNLLKPFDDKKVAGVFSKQIPREDITPPDMFAYGQDYPDKLLRIDKNNVQSISVTFSDVSSAYRRKLLVDNPFMDDILVSEDVYWANTMIDKSYAIVYNPASKVIHSHTYTLQKKLRLIFDQGVATKQMASAGVPSFSATNSSSRFKNKLTYLYTEKQYRWIVTTVITDGLRFGAIFLGINYTIIPTGIRKKMTNLPRQMP